MVLSTKELRLMHNEYDYGRYVSLDTVPAYPNDERSPSIDFSCTTYNTVHIKPLSMA